MVLLAHLPEHHTSASPLPDASWPTVASCCLAETSGVLAQPGAAERWWQHGGRALPEDGRGLTPCLGDWEQSRPQAGPAIGVDAAAPL